MWWIRSSLWIFCSGVQQLGTCQCREFYENHLNSTWLWAFRTCSESKQNDLEETLFLLILFYVFVVWINLYLFCFESVSTISGFKRPKHVWNHAWTDKKICRPFSITRLFHWDMIPNGWIHQTVFEPHHEIMIISRDMYWWLFPGVYFWCGWLSWWAVSTTWKTHTTLW